MRRSVLMVLVVAVVALVFAPVAMAQDDNPTGDDRRGGGGSRGFDDNPTGDDVMASPTATATSTATGSATATPTATSTASGTATAGGGGGGGGKKADKLPRTGGPAPIALLAGVALVGSGVVALSYVRRREVS
jgi:LPXTG-motif cell wall-anchored protein